MNAVSAPIPNRASRAIMPDGAVPGSRPLVVAGLVSLALHGAILCAATWPWGPTAPPAAPPLVAVPLVPETMVRSNRQARRIAPATQPDDAATRRALAGLAAAKRQAHPSPKPAATGEPKKAKIPVVHPVWGKTPPVPPHPPRFRLEGGQEAGPPARAKSPPPDPRADHPVAVKTAPAMAAPEGGRGSGQTAKTTHSEAPGPMGRPRPVAGLGNPRPQYPWISRRRGEQGRVVLEVAVAADGRAKEVRVKRSSGFARLDRAALAAVRAWRFSPALRGGRAVAGRIDVPIAFRLTK
ncbi:MAG: energy transducer TonB [Alphaproteobacteria bacterium]|nr:energy transducer TonB [Alphaproteobacteria bacterium]